MTASGLLRFDLLGPLRVTHDRTAIAVPVGQRSAVLAVLLLSGNHPASRERIIAAIWGDQAPAYAVNLLQKHISGLRQTLAPTGNGTACIDWTPAGYLLALQADCLDVRVFERHLAAGRTARAIGDLRAAARDLNRALDLWRGPVCEGLSSPLIDAERSRLAEERTGALEDRIEVDLALGSGPQLVPELRQLVEAHPLRERLRAAQMLALYRSGRPGDALAAYREARRYLADELAIDPMPELQRLHERILRADPALAADQSAGAVTTAERVAVVEPLTEPGPGIAELSSVVRLAQLPHGIADFAGRAAELKRLNAVLKHFQSGQPAPAIVAIVGGAGVGKTTLAVEWCHRVRSAFPDGELYVNLRGFDPTGSAMQSGEAVRSFLDALGVTTQQLPITVEAQSGLLRSLLANRRMLIVLDNARDVDQIRTLLPGAPGCLIVVTSRNELTGLVSAHGAVPLSIDLLDRDEARELLRRRLGEQRVSEQSAAIDLIIASCARLPLALAVVAARAAMRPSFSLGELVTELGAGSGSLDAFEGGDSASDVRGVFSWSYVQLAPAAGRLFRLLGLHHGPEITESAAAALSNATPRGARAMLGDLTRANLLKEIRPRRFAMHDLLRAYANELVLDVDNEEERRRALERLLDHFVQSAQIADQVMNPGRDPVQAMKPITPHSATVPVAEPAEAIEWFIQEHAVLLAVITQACEAGFDPYAYQLAWSVSTFFDRRGHWHDAVATQSVALQAAERMHDDVRVAYAHRGLARGYGWRNMFSEAARHFTTALDIFSNLGDRTGLAQTRRAYGWILERQGNYAAALAQTRLALELFRETEKKAGLAESLNAVGWFEAQLDQPDLALLHCEEALTLHQSNGHPEGEAHTWDSLGFIHHELHHLQKSIQCYTQAIAIWVRIADGYYETATLTRLGAAYADAGHRDEARKTWNRALTTLPKFDQARTEEVRQRLAELGAQPDAPQFTLDVLLNDRES